MTQEEKELIYKDLCARIPYKTIVKLSGNGLAGNKDLCIVDIIDLRFYLFYLGDVNPYLRPMSSMTDDERKELYGLLLNIERLSFADIIMLGKDTISPAYDWLHSKHFDYRGLISKGLAIEAHNGMYNN